MATTTPNLGLKKPEETDKVNVTDLNGGKRGSDFQRGHVGNGGLRAQLPVP